MKTSSKLINIETLAAIQKYANSGNKLCFLTAYGFITGKLADYTEEELSVCDKSNSLEDFMNNSVDFNLLKFVSHMKNLIVNSQEDLEIVDVGSLITLEDVQIFHGDLAKPVLSTNFFLLHATDIIGFLPVPEDSPIG